jgi:hypothetical protein
LFIEGGVINILAAQKRDINDQKLQEHQALLNRLSPFDFAAQQCDIERRRAGGTGRWLLESTGFRNWVNGKHPALFGHRMPGAGKTIIAAMVIEHLVHKIMTTSVVSESAFTASTVHGRCPTV